MPPDVAEAEGASVRRWDAVAGGTGADWENCLRLLERAAADVGRDDASSSETTVTNSRRRGRPRPLSPPYRGEVQTEFDEFPDDVGNVYDCDAACRDGRCRSVVWEDAFRMALASSIDIFPKGDGVGGGTTADGRKTTTVDLVRNNDNDNIDEVPVISDDGFSSSRPKTAIIMQKRPTDKRELSLSNNFSSSLTAVVGKSDELSASEKMTAIGRRCSFCGVQCTTLFRLMAYSQLVCRQCRRGRVRI
ncbi:hypothetical protein ACHAW5_010748 [Stephanodiscus triporus]|uniref:Uncharacterized protein n=1 Tax=Stephanodiscus triporus TaxID=2934178 RepID=A0ABD3MJT8_9STRA